MKKVTLLICLLLVGFLQAQNLDQKTKNIIKAKFIGAKEYFAENKYNEALTKITEIEELTGKPTLATALDLKVQLLLALNKIDEAEKEINTLMGMNLSNTLVSNVSNYSKQITSKKEEIKEIEKRKKIRKQKIIEAKIKQEIEDRKYIKSLFSENPELTLTSTVALNRNTNETLYGFFDSEMELKIDYQYKIATDMINGIATVTYKDGSINLINEDNQKLLKENYTESEKLPESDLYKNTYLLTKEKDNSTKKIALFNLYGKKETLVFNDYFKYKDGSYMFFSDKKEMSLFIYKNKIINNLTTEKVKFDRWRPSYENVIFVEQNNEFFLILGNKPYVSKKYKEINFIKKEYQVQFNFITTDNNNLKGYLHFSALKRIVNNNYEDFNKIFEIKPTYKTVEPLSDERNLLILENHDYKKGVIAAYANKIITPIEYSIIKYLPPSYEWDNDYKILCKTIEEENSKRWHQYSSSGLYLGRKKVK